MKILQTSTILQNLFQKVSTLESAEWEFDFAEYLLNAAEFEDDEYWLGTFNGALLFFPLVLEVPMELLWDFLGTIVSKVSSLSESCSSGSRTLLAS